MSSTKRYSRPSFRSPVLETDTARRSAGGLIAVLAPLVLLGSCTGLFQDGLPRTAQSFARHSEGVLRVGVGSADITPRDESPYLGGFNLNRQAEGVASKLAARAMVFDVAGGERIAIVGVDNLGLHLQDVDYIKAGIDGFANGNVFVCASHTHAAPDLIGMWGKYFLTSGRDTEYLEIVAQGVRAAVRDALESARPATLRRGEARMPPRGLARNTNRAGVFDPRLTVLQAVAIDGSEDSIGSLIHLACHPEVLRRGDSVVSSDLVGSLCDAWEDAGHGPAVFANGALGAMITPKPHGVDNLRPVGETLREIAERAFAAAVPVANPGDIEVRRREVFLPMQSWALRIGRLTMVIPRELYEGCLRSTVGYLRIGDFEAVCLPGEAEPGYAQRIRNAVHKPDLLVFGLCDDELGYLMTERDARDELFAYERTMSPGPRAGEIVMDAVVGAGKD